VERPGQLGCTLRLRPIRQDRARLPGTRVRLVIGLEAVDDLQGDLAQARAVLG